MTKTIIIKPESTEIKDYISDSAKAFVDNILNYVQNKTKKNPSPERALQAELQ